MVYGTLLCEVFHPNNPNVAVHLILTVSFHRIVGLGTGLSLGEHVHPTLAPSAELVRHFSF